MGILGIEPLTDAGSAGEVNVWKEESPDQRAISHSRKHWCICSIQSFQESSGSQVPPAAQSQAVKEGVHGEVYGRLWPLCKSCHSVWGVTDKSLVVGLRQLLTSRANSR